MVTYFTFFEHGMPGNTGLRAEPDGDAPDEVNFHSKVKKNPLKKRCGSQPHHGTFLRMLSFRADLRHGSKKVRDPGFAESKVWDLDGSWTLHVLFAVGLWKPRTSKLCYAARPWKPRTSRF